MSWFRPTTLLDKVFEVGIIIKGINGILETLAGLLLLFLTPQRLQHFIEFVTQLNVNNEKQSKIITMFLHSVDHLGTGNRIFLIAYFWSHAAVKLTAVIGILTNKLWAYPFSLITLGVLTLFQFGSIIHKASIGMILLTIFDLFILWLIWREYGKVKIKLAEKKDKD